MKNELNQKCAQKPHVFDLELFICNYFWVLIWPHPWIDGLANDNDDVICKNYAAGMRVFICTNLKAGSFHSNFMIRLSRMWKIVVALAATIIYTFAWVFWFKSRIITPQNWPIAWNCFLRLGAWPQSRTKNWITSMICVWCEFIFGGFIPPLRNCQSSSKKSELL